MVGSASSSGTQGDRDQQADHNHHNALGTASNGNQVELNGSDHNHHNSLGTASNGNRVEVNGSGNHPLIQKYIEAMEKKDWKNAKNEIQKLLDEGGHEELNKKINDKDQTALYIAVTHGCDEIVQLLAMNMSEEGLKAENGDKITAVMMAALLGDVNVAKGLIGEKEHLVSGAHSGENKRLPVVMAIDFGQIDMARYLYELNPEDPKLTDCSDQDRNGAMLLTRAIYCGALDIALALMHKSPKLALAVDDQLESPILAMARSTRYYFPDHNHHNASGTASNGNQVEVNGSDHNHQYNALGTASNGNQVEGNGSGILGRWQGKKIHEQYDELLSQMGEVISNSNTQQRKDGLVYTAIGCAAENGNLKFVREMIKVDISFQWTCYSNDPEDLRRNIFMIAVLHRQENIFNILYELKQVGMRKYLTGLVDKDDNNILHLAGTVKNSSRLNQLSGAALQMQRELQWFKEVEKMVHPMAKESPNKEGLTPRQLFTKNHENLMEKGEKWMKDTATSCTVVAAFVVTIIFAAAFTIPGRDDDKKGLPIFIKIESAEFFIICDALSLCFSTVSVLMFLGILTSRYSEDDFLEKLPRKMIIGLISLFGAITTMLAVFLIVILIELHKRSWTVLAFGCLAIAIATLFILLMFRLLVGMMKSTYWPGIFGRN